MGRKFWNLVIYNARFCWKMQGFVERFEKNLKFEKLIRIPQWSESQSQRFGDDLNPKNGDIVSTLIPTHSRRAPRLRPVYFVNNFQGLEWCNEKKAGCNSKTSFDIYLCDGSKETKFESFWFCKEFFKEQIWSIFENQIQSHGHFPRRCNHKQNPKGPKLEAWFWKSTKRTNYIHYIAAY